jgi:hypothetical protein
VDLIEKSMVNTKLEMEKETKKRIMKSYKNLAAVCIGWFLLVVSFGSLQGLVSSINHDIILQWIFYL